MAEFILRFVILRVILLVLDVLKEALELHNILLYLEGAKSSRNKC